MPARKFFFLGFPVDTAMARAMEQCDPSDRAFFEDPMYLDAHTLSGVRYLGRRLPEVASLNQLMDTARNVVSLIRRVVPDWPGRADDAAIWSLEGDIPQA
jgi:hypothetical protein